MTRELLNTLYVATPGAYVRAEGETLKVEVDGETLLRVPSHHLGAVVLMGRVWISGEAAKRCAEEGRPVMLLDEAGRFQARITGPTSGNVLLRAAQYAAHADSVRTATLARMFVAGKIRNSRNTLLRAARETRDEERGLLLRAAVTGLETALGALGQLSLTGPVDPIRGCEGQAAALYFEAFPALLSVPTAEFAFAHRSRRPPRDRMNALLSFLYALLTSDCQGALEGVGLDPQFGYLHALRPGRPALALDLVEEFRSPLADRLALTLVNRRQLKPDDFEERPGGSFRLTSEARKAVLAAYQRRKQEEVSHPLLTAPVPLGLAPHLQARLLARHLRGELADYPPFLSR